MFPSLAEAAEVRARTQDDILPRQADQLRHTESRLECDEEQRAITTADRGGGVGHRQQGVHFGDGEKLDDLPFKPSAGMANNRWHSSA